MATSRDGVNFERPWPRADSGTDRGRRVSGEPRRDLRQRPLSHVLLLPAQHRLSREKGYRIGYATSSDLLNWTRDDARAGIDVSETGWDAEMISYPHVFELDGRTLMLYLGNQVGRAGFGLAELEGTLLFDGRSAVCSSEPQKRALPNGCTDFAQSPRIHRVRRLRADLFLHPQPRRGRPVSWSDRLCRRRPRPAAGASDTPTRSSHSAASGALTSTVSFPSMS